MLSDRRVEYLRDIPHGYIGIFAESALAQRAGGNDNIGIACFQIVQGVYCDILALLVTQRQAAKRTATSNALVTVLRRFNQVSNRRNG